ncbi:MAG TPA: hypothetical protein VF815_05085 [Myxococcaceae bacterium]|jgi:hypothetical protein
MPQLSNYEILVNAGLIKEPNANDQGYSQQKWDDFKAQINSLSQAEIDAIISVKQKLGLSGHLNHGIVTTGF